MTDGWVFYAFWNGEMVRDVFEAIVNVTNSSEFTTLASCVAVLALIAAVIAGAARYEGRHIIAFIVGVIFLWFVAVVPKVTVVVEDVRSESVTVVDNVPLGIGVFGSMINRIGYWLATGYESAFAPVESAKFSRFGAVYPERVLEALQAVGPVTSEGRATLDAVVQACIVPEVLTDRVKAASLTHSSDIWASVTASGWVNPARYAAMPDGQVLACPQAVEQLNRVLEDVELPAIKAMLGARFAPDHVDPGATVATHFPEAERLLLGVSRTMDATLKHAVMMTVLPETTGATALRQDGPMALAVGLAKAQGNLAAEINYRTMSRIAEETLPKIRNALELIVIGCFPIVILLALAGGQRMGLIVRSYLMLLVTVELWPALASIVNYLVIGYDAHPFGRIAQTFGGSTLQSVALIRETGASSQAIAGWLMCAVPMIAYALVRAGDMAVGQLVGGLTAPAQSAASSQGGALAAGNIQQGNVGMGNVTMNTVSGNKHDLSVAAASPATVVTRSAYGQVTRDEGGVVTGLTRTDVNFGVSGSTSQSLSRLASSSHLVQTSSTWSDAARFNVVQSATSQDATQRQFAHALRDAINEMRASVETASHGNTVNEGLSVSRGVDMARTDRVSEGTSVGSGGRIGFSIDNHNLQGVGAGGNPLGVNLTASYSPTNTLSVPGLFGQVRPPVQSDGLDSMTGMAAQGNLGTHVNFAATQDLIDQANGKQSTTAGAFQQEAYTLLRQASDTVAKSHADESVRSAARQFSESLGRNVNVSRNESQTMTDSMTAVGLLSQSRQGTLTTTKDDSVSVMRTAIAESGSAEQVLRNMYVGERTDAVAGTSHLERHMAVSPQDDFGVGTMVPVADRVATVRDDAIANVEEKHVAFKKEFAGSAPRLAAEPTPNLAVDRVQRFEADYQANRQGAQAGYRLGEEQVALQRGVLMIAREAYRQKSDDKNYALRNAFLFGLGYQSGEDLQEKLKAKAGDNEHVRQMLINIGSRSEVDVTDEDWKRLMTQVKH